MINTKKTGIKYKLQIDNQRRSYEYSNEYNKSIESIERIYVQEMNLLKHFGTTLTSHHVTYTYTTQATVT